MVREILDEASVEPIAMVMRRRRLEWFGHVKKTDETENIRAVVEIKGGCWSRNCLLIFQPSHVIVYLL